MAGQQDTDMTVNTNITQQSWSSISKEAAKSYLHYYPKDTINGIAYFIKETYGKKCRILDIGCGNAQIYTDLKNSGIDIIYTGVDFSKTLIEEARKVTKDCPDAKIVESDCYAFLESNSDEYDVAICSHLLELIESPDLLLHYLSNFCEHVAIRWYEPPVNKFHITEVRESAHPSHSDNAPYIRRKMSEDYYINLLNKHRLKLIRSEGRGKDILHLLKSV